MRVLLWTVSCALLTLCCAHSPVCNGTQDGNQTTFIISGLPPVSSKHCHYAWNRNGHVLANHKEQDDKMVIISSINSLVTSGCLPEIDFIRSCTTELEAYAVNCTCPCHGALFQGDKEISRSRFGAFAAVASFIVLLLVVGLCGIGTMCRSGQFGCGRKMNRHKLDVEAGTE